MADAPVAHIGENSMEEVAYKLFRHVVAVEGKVVTNSGSDAANRAYILDTYAECYLAIKDAFSRDRAAKK